jgi:hypothetical protein
MRKKEKQLEDCAVCRIPVFKDKSMNLRTCVWFCVGNTQRLAGSSASIFKEISFSKEILVSKRKI